MTTIADDPQTMKTKGTETKLPPGPKPLPIPFLGEYLGDLLSLRQDPLGFIQQLQRTYGNMATIHIGKQPAVFLFKPEYVRYALVEHPQNFRNTGVLSGNDNSDDPTANDEGLLTIDGVQHRQQRRAVQPAFHKKQVEGYASTIEEYTQEVLKKWHAGDVVDMSQAMQQLTLRIICKCLFDIDLERQISAIGSAFNGILASNASIAEDLLRIHIDNPVTGYGRRMAAQRQLDMMIYTMIAQRRADEHEHNDVLSMLLDAPYGNDPEVKLNDKQVHDHILTFIAAGHETTAIALVWTFYLLSEHPDVYEKLLNEIKLVVGERTPTLEDLGKMQYLEWVLNESMRLYPPAWTQARFVAKDVEFDGVRLPAGTMVFLSQWVIHRLPELWGDAENFRPERWDPLNEQSVPPGAYFPFGGGPRMCIGMPLAQLESKLVLAMVLQHFTPQNLPGYKPGLNPTITLRPKNPLKSRLMPTAMNSTVSQWKQIVPISDPSIAGARRKGCLGMLMSLLGLA
jgi:cytochrome P450